MRIVIDLQACQTASRQRGIGRYSLALADALTRNAGEHELSLLVTSAFPESVEWLRERFRAAIPPERVHVFVPPGPVAESEPDNRWRTRAAEAIREAFVATLRPDALLLSSLFEGFVDDATTSVAAQADYVRAATLYDLIPLVRPELLATPEARAWYARKVSALHRADLLLAISDHARSEALTAAELAGDRIVVVSTAADACFRLLDLGESERRAIFARHGIAKPYVLYAGGFDARKNVSRLVEAYAALPPEIRDSHALVLAGALDESGRRALKRIAERRGLDAGRLCFIGYVDDAELAALYNLCTAFAFPSLHEGFGLPVLEAMACGAPVIASRASSIPEVLERTDALFDPLDVHAITSKLHEVLTDAALRDDLARYGRARAAAFSWDRTARRALSAIVQACERRPAPRSATVAAPEIAFVARDTTLPTLAFVSPLPPERTGIAFYAAELLEPLAAHYRIELVTDQKAVELPSGVAGLPVRTVEWFDRNAHRYDRTLYQLGNSPFHRHMFELIDRHPGTAVLHDLYLGAVLNWMEQYGAAPGIFMRWLFESHGYPGMLAQRDRGREAIIDGWPSSWPVIDRAHGVIVHSAHALSLAARWFRVDPGEWQRIPQLRRLPDAAGRAAARAALGVEPEDRLFCSFGFLDATKLDERIVDAWLASPLAGDPRCRLVFVGENHGGDYGRALAQKIAPHERIRITGYTDAAAFEAWLRAADTAIQLRGVTRGETSRTALDCLAYGLPLIVNASGSLAELPGAAVMRVPADFADAELADAMTALARDAGLRERLGERARKHIAQRHDPVVIAAAYRDAIERFAHESRGARYAQAVRDVAAIEVTPDARPGDWRAAAQSIALLLRRPPARQLLVDVSILARQDLRTGIERVVRAVLLELLERAPAGWRVEPVVAGRECYRYGRQFTASWLGVPGSVGDDAPIEVAAGDVFFGLDWAANIVPDEEPVLQRYRTLGVSVVFLVHDLLPILRPDFYPVGIDAMHATWLSTVSRVADGVFCVSNSVIDDLVAWLDQHGANRESALGLAVLPLASDISRSVPTHGVPPDAAALRTEIARRKSVLMVGTLEARKAHAQALAGFEQLWRSGVDVNLVVAGKQGWMVDDLASRMRAHPEMGRRLFWFESASDEWLDALYADADVLLAPSLGEGFGLPLIEAARHGVPIIARDLPVFREVAGAHAMYFSGTSPADIASAIVDWQRAGETGDVPDSSRIAYRDWRASVDRLLDVIIEGRWERAWRPPGHASDKPVAMRQIDFSRAWLPSAVRAIKGLSGREHWGRWSDADIHPHVEISFRDPLPASGSLALTARAFGPNVGQPIRVRIGRHETELRFDAHDTTAVASYALGQAPQLLEIVPPHPTQPCTLGDSQDPRRLGIGLVRLTIQASATSEA